VLTRRALPPARRLDDVVELTTPAVEGLVLSHKASLGPSHGKRPYAPRRDRPSDLNWQELGDRRGRVLFRLVLDHVHDDGVLNGPEPHGTALRTA
jgi:hypothetical protein